VRGFDTDGHGTHCCGIVAGRNLGVAPEVSLYVASVIESETIFTSVTRVAAGLNWIFRQFTRPDNEHLPAVLSMSLGFPGQLAGVPEQEWKQRLHTLRVLLRTLVQANVLPIVAIGNDGAGTFGYPGAFKQVLAVGAVGFDEAVASFSGSGQPPGEGVSKPDLVGYGVGVRSSIERDYSGESVYQRLNGTSMATPYVAGIAALYRSLQPTLTVQQVWDKLRETAKPLPVSSSRVGRGLARYVP
jgi:subtilisin family serine protease